MQTVLQRQGMQGLMLSVRMLMEAQQVTLRWLTLCIRQAKQQSFRWGMVCINSQELAVLLDNLVSCLIVGLLCVVCNGTIHHAVVL